MTIYDEYMRLKKCREIQKHIKYLKSNLNEYKNSCDIGCSGCHFNNWICNGISKRQNEIKKYESWLYWWKSTDICDIKFEKGKSKYWCYN